MKASRRQMAYTAAAMYGGAVVVNLVEGAIPGGPALTLLPGFAALGFVGLLLAVGPRLPRPALFALGPIGAALIAYALATTPPDQNDGALLYVWPVLWVTYFFGRRGAIFIAAWVAAVHGVAVIAMEDGVFDRWMDVAVSVAVVAVVVHSLVEANRRLVARLAAEARVDKLTGVLNRRGFHERAEVEVERARRQDGLLGAATFDIDYFKRINDEWGHETGDRVLEHLGEVLRTESRSADVVARMGGEEFVALLPDVDAEGAWAYAERVREAFAHGDGLGLPAVTVSAGVSAAIAPAGVDGLLQSADSALYAAKRAGRDRVLVS
ncbi:MAG TPA: GGDEF domain-containing protein [Thermoleophilaceae bacterium]|nr:GGDEF domain-containing protein [Thermoleophilaceae bacterium]